MTRRIPVLIGTAMALLLMVSAFLSQVAFAQDDNDPSNPPIIVTEIVERPQEVPRTGDSNGDNHDNPGVPAPTPDEIQSIPGIRTLHKQNVRYGAGLNYKIVGVVPKGTCLTLAALPDSEVYPEWVAVDFNGQVPGGYMATFDATTGSPLVEKCHN